MKRFVFVLLCAFSVFAQSNLNWRGIDTSIVYNFGADSLKFSKTFNISNAENKTLYIMCNDTSNAGFANDTISFEWGYQIGSLRRVGSLWDTVWSINVVVDTCDLDSVYNPSTYAADRWLTGTDGTITAVYGIVDTSSLTGYVYQWHDITPPWGHYLRMYFKGLSSNVLGSCIKLIAGIDQRDYQKSGR